jgi:two-component system response regulator
VLDGERQPILLADDDEDDRLLACDALAEAGIRNEVHTVQDGVELLDYLYRRGPYIDPEDSPRPGLILLDLNMPRLDGREALESIKQDPALRSIPVVALTTSGHERDIARVYELGANSYIVKPADFAGLTQVMQALGQYWFEIVEPPPSTRG